MTIRDEHCVEIQAMIKDKISRHSMEMTAAREYNKELSGQLEAAVSEREQLKWTIAATHEFLQSTVKQFHDQYTQMESALRISEEQYKEAVLEHKEPFKNHYLMAKTKRLDFVGLTIGIAEGHYTSDGIGDRELHTTSCQY
ncbi:hypothetical protein BGX34_008548 [Mortierella sp. NVP85]|nr:hypothetical protein BGX34_008548 [Mortierella sp. NVP85]